MILPLLKLGLALLQFQPLASYSIRSPKVDTVFDYEIRVGFNSRWAEMDWGWERENGGNFKLHTYDVDFWVFSFNDIYREANEINAQSITANLKKKFKGVSVSLGGGCSFREYTEPSMIAQTGIKWKNLEATGESNKDMSRRRFDFKFSGKPIKIYGGFKITPKFIYSKIDDNRCYFQCKMTGTYTF